MYKDTGREINKIYKKKKYFTLSEIFERELTIL